MHPRRARIGFVRHGLVFASMLALAVQFWLGLGVMPPHAASATAGSFVAELCTSQGRRGDSVPAPNSPNEHSCCTFCAPASSWLPRTASLAVPPAQTWRSLPIKAVERVATASRYRSPPSRAPPQV